MNFVPFSEFRNAVRVLVPMAPVPAVDRALRSAAIDFCRVSEAIRESLASVTLVAGQNVANLGLSSEIRANAIQEARYDGRDLPLTSPRDLGNNMPRWDLDSGDPELIYLSSGTEVTVAPRPATTDPSKLRLVISVEPKYNATKLPAELAEAYFQAIVDGAVGHLMEMAGTDWSNPGAATGYKTRAAAAAVDAKSRADHSSTRRRRTVKFSY